MKKTKLIVLLSKTLTKPEVVRLSAIDDEDYYTIPELLELTFYHKQEVGFKAAWILEQICFHHQSRFKDHLSSFLTGFSLQENPSVRRVFAKILAFVTGKDVIKDIKVIIENFDTSYLTEVVFEWLINDKVAVAVKAHCLTILANLNNKHCWIKDELLQTIDFLVDKESVGFFSKAKKIRMQLK